MGIVGPSQRPGLSQAKVVWTTEFCAIGGCLGGGQHTVGT